MLEDGPTLGVGCQQRATTQSLRFEPSGYLTFSFKL